MRIFTKPLFCLTFTLWLVACGTTQGPQPGSDAASGRAPTTEQRAGASLFSSPECLAKNLKPGEPFPSTAIPAAALASRISGSVAVRYDVVAGLAQNLVVVASSPPGLYDEAVLRHAAKYRDPTNSTVRGCVMTIEVKF